MHRTRDGRRYLLGISSILFFASGFSGLMYEVIWFKRFAHIWGNSTLAVACVVASFLCGLGLGAHWIGALADRSKRPLFLYGSFECMVGVLAFLIPYEIFVLCHLLPIWHPILAGHPLFHCTVRFTATFLVLGPPCILMGGTLPLLVRAFTPSGVSPTARTGWFYAVNTLGAACGCYAAGFHVLPSIGLYWSNMCAATLNVAVGIGAIVLSRHFHVGPVLSHTLSEAGGAEPGGHMPAVRSHSAGTVYLAAAVTGFAALVLQMIWIRQLSLILGGSTYAFTSVLCIFIIGIGLGSLCFHVWLRRLLTLDYVLVGALLLIVASSVIGYLLIPSLTFAVSLLRPLRSSQVWNALVCVLASGALEFFPAAGMGLLFPIYVHLTAVRSGKVGKAVGHVYAWNTVGTIVGASVTAALLIPALGVTSTLGCALCVYILSLNLLFPKGGRIRNVLQIAFTVCGCALICVLIRPCDPRITNSGMYLYGYTPPHHLVARHQLVYYREGASCNVLVTESAGQRSLRVNGKVDASTGGDMKMQLGLAYLPRFLAPQAKSVMNIGFGSGTSVGASLLFPDTHVTCCEIEPAVFAASPCFHRVNHQPERSSHLRMVFDDGRNHLQGTRQKYDMILSEPSNPWLAGVANLFTREFYETARKRLNERGILAQWLQLYSLSASEYALVVRTFVHVFPHCALLQISQGDTILLGSDSPLDITKDTVGAAQALVNQRPEIRTDLETNFGSSNVAVLLLQHLIMREEGLRQLAAYHHSPGINSDLNMRLEYEAPLRLFGDMEADEEPYRILLEAADVGWCREVVTKSGWTKEQISALCPIIDYFVENKHNRLAAQLTKVGRETAPDEPQLLALEYLVGLPTVDGKTWEKQMDQIVRESPQRASRLGVSLWKAGRYDEAVGIFKRLSCIHTASATIWANLGVNYAALGQAEKAKEALGKAMTLDPFSDFTRDSYANIKDATGDDMKQLQQRSAD